jgi:hypothetical protein
MVDGSDPTATQAWLIAIPSAITAISTWYMSRKATKVGKSAATHTERVVGENSDKTMQEICELKKRVSGLELAVQQTRESQLVMAQRQIELMSSFKASTIPADVPKVEPNPVVRAEPEKVTLKGTAQAPFGKVILKP